MNKPIRLELPLALYVGEADENGEGGHYVTAVIVTGEKVEFECREVGPIFPEAEYIDVSKYHLVANAK